MYINKILLSLLDRARFTNPIIVNCAYLKLLSISLHGFLTGSLSNATSQKRPPAKSSRHSVGSVNV